MAEKATSKKAATKKDEEPQAKHQIVDAQGNISEGTSVPMVKREVGQGRGEVIHSGVIRDFVPSDEPLNPMEKQRFTYIREARDNEDIRPDFVPPAEGYEASVPTQDEARAEAEAAIVQTGRFARAEQYDDAVRFLRGADAPVAVANMQQMSLDERSVFLLAEKDNRARKTVLEQFSDYDVETEKATREQLKARAEEEGK